MKEDAEIWKIKSENFDKALKSNLEDQRVTNALAGELLTQVADLSEERDFYKSQARNAYVMGNVLSTLPAATLLTVSIIEYANGNMEGGKDYLIASGIALASVHLVYQSGHWIFKWW